MSDTDITPVNCRGQNLMQEDAVFFYHRILSQDSRKLIIDFTKTILTQNSQNHNFEMLN